MRVVAVVDVYLEESGGLAEDGGCLLLDELVDFLYS